MNNIIKNATIKQKNNEESKEENLHFIIPSFYRFFIKSLYSEKFDLKIIFRTFGSDIPEIYEEFN